MTLKSLSRCLLLLCLFCADSHAKSLSLTFDDGLNPDENPQAHIINAQLLETLQQQQIQAMIFPALDWIGGQAGLDIIKMWSTAGQFVGNHSASHQSLAAPNMTLNAFIADVLRADTAFRSLKTWLPLLRFPYLQEGETREKRDGMRRWLHEHDYRPAPVSIETVDWFYNSRFLDLEKNPQPEKLSALKQDYLAHVLECANFYDAQAQRVLGRSPLHVMLLHVNALNAAMLPDIIDTFKARGWTFISTKTAFDDPLYLEQPDSLPAGGSLIAALAQERGEKVFNTRVKSERDNPCLKNRSSID